MKTLARRTSAAIRRSPVAAARGVGGIVQGIPGILRVPKIVFKRRLTQALMKRLSGTVEYSPQDLTRLIHRPGHKTFGYRASNGFHVEIVDDRGFARETVEEREYNHSGLLTKLTVHVPGEGRYIWNYRKPGSWTGSLQGARTSNRIRAIEKLKR